MDTTTDQATIKALEQRLARSERDLRLGLGVSVIAIAGVAAVAMTVGQLQTSIRKNRLQSDMDFLDLNDSIKEVSQGRPPLELH